jgi:membrane protein
VSTAWEGLRYYVSGIYNRAGEDGIFLMASGMSFSFIICLIPLVLIIFSVLGIILDRASIRESLTSYIDSAIPYPEYAEAVKQFVFERVKEFTLHKTLAGVIGIAGLLFASSGLFGTMQSILHRIFRIEETLSILKAKARDMWLVLLSMAFFLVLITIVPAAGVALRYIADHALVKSLELDVLTQGLMHLMSITLTMIVCGSIYYAVPQQRPSFRAVLVGALAAALLWEIAKVAFSVYLSRAVMLQRIYGAYVFLVASAFWIYYSALVFIVGAQIGRLHLERRR